MSKRVFEAWRGATLFKSGMGQVLICRHKNNGETEAGVFLVDAYCLGVKDAFFTRFETSKLESMLEKIFQLGGRESLSPACARKLVEDAVAYARSLGLGPHPDYKQAARVLGGINARECDTVFTFGHEGKPLYVQGPNDSPEFAQRVMTILGKRLGSENFHYLAGGPIEDELEAEEERPEKQA